MTTDAVGAVHSVAITGAGSGLGREIAIGFADKRYRVFGTARTPEEVKRRATRAAMPPSSSTSPTRLPS